MTEDQFVASFGSYNIDEENVRMLYRHSPVSKAEISYQIKDNGICRPNNEHFWLTPKGSVYYTRYAGHASLLRTMFGCDDDYGYNSYSMVEDAGWIHVSDGCVSCVRVKPTRIQLEILAQFGRREPEMHWNIERYQKAIPFGEQYDVKKTLKGNSRMK